jgi:hypothetical protein
MLPRRARFTVRQLMVTVAVVGAALAGGRTISAVVQQWDVYSSRARMWAWYEQQERAFIRDVPFTLKALKDTPSDREYRAVLEARVQHAQRRIPYFNTMRRKYQRAALFPWSSVPPDPPEPK